MRLFKTLLPVVAIGLLAGGSVMAASVSLGISGPGAVNDSTIKAGEPVSVDIYFVNDTVYTGFTLGFAMRSPDSSIKKVVHPVDSGNGANERGDVKAYNGWEDLTVWDLAGLFVVERDWDGELPELLGFGGVCVKKKYVAHDKQKNLSIDLVVPEPGTLVIDSAFFPPGGNWLYSPPPHEPSWGGPYKFKVVK